MESLPTEIVLKIVKNLDLASVISLEQVCVRLRSIISELWAQELLRLAEHDSVLRHRLSDVHGLKSLDQLHCAGGDGKAKRALQESIGFVYKKLKGEVKECWDEQLPTIKNRQLKEVGRTFGRFDKTVGVAHFEMLGSDKFLIGYEDDLIEVRQTSDFRALGVLNQCDVEELPRFGCPFATHGSTVVARNTVKNCLALWDAESFHNIGNLDLTPSESSVEHVRRIVVNKRAIVCWQGLHIYVWPYDFSSDFQQRPPLMIMGVPDVDAWTKTFQKQGARVYMQMNDDFLVTSIANFYESKIQRRKFDHRGLLTADSAAEAITLVKSEKCERPGFYFMVDRISLAKTSNLLAILQKEGGGMVVHIKDVPTDKLLYSLPPCWSAPLGTKNRPVGWVGNTFFFTDVQRSFDTMEGALCSYDMDSKTLKEMPIWLDSHDHSDIFSIGTTHLTQLFTASIRDTTQSSSLFGAGSVKAHFLKTHDFWEVDEECELVENHPFWLSLNSANGRRPPGDDYPYSSEDDEEEDDEDHGDDDDDDEYDEEDYFLEIINDDQRLRQFVRMMDELHPPPPH